MTQLEKIKQSIEYIPVLTAALFIYSITRLYVYYQWHFGVPIFDYISLGELIKVSIVDFLPFMLVLSLLTVNAFLLKKSKIKTQIIFGGILSLIGIGILLFFVISAHDDPRIAVVLETFCLILIGFFCFGAFYKMYADNSLMLTIVLVIFSSFIGVVTGLYKGFQVANYPERTNIIIKLKTNDKAIVSTADYFYIGRSDNVYFYFNNKTKTTEVINNDDVKNISFDAKALYNVL